MKKTILLLYMCFLIILAGCSPSQQQPKKDVGVRLDKILKSYDTSQEKKSFIKNCLEEIDNNYRLGNNYIIEATNETKTFKNNYGDVVQVEMSNKFYIAKSHFEKTMDSLKMLEAADKEMLSIKNNLIKAAELRIESVDLYTKGLYLKERIGKMASSNKLSALEGTSPALLPEYNGEAEKGLGKIAVANSYLIDALMLLRDMCYKYFSYEHSSLQFIYIQQIADLISYYSNVSETDYDTYVNNGKNYLETYSFFDAVISLNKALKIKPNEKEVLLNLIKAYRGINNHDKAAEIIKKTETLYPDLKELEEFKAKTPLAESENTK